MCAHSSHFTAGEQEAEGAVKAGVKAGGGAALPGMIFNTKKKVKYHDAVTQQDREVYAGRMECTMQVYPPSCPLVLFQPTLAVGNVLDGSVE
jgi:hypothetical protein